MYLTRKADNGTPAFEDILYIDYQGDKMPRFSLKSPTGSCADIRAKGVWSKDKWIIEFARAIDTGNTDDIQFDTSVMNVERPRIEKAEDIRDIFDRAQMKYMDYIRGETGDIAPAIQAMQNINTVTKQFASSTQ